VSIVKINAIIIVINRTAAKCPTSARPGLPI